MTKKIVAVILLPRILLCVAVGIKQVSIESRGGRRGGGGYLIKHFRFK